MTDYTTLITSEHNQKPKFVSVVDLVANGIGDVTALMNSLPSQFDLDNAVGNQLDIVGEWIGQSRNIPNVVTINYFGFSDNPNAAGFGDLNNPAAGGPFFDLGGSTGTSAVLDDGTYRTVLRAKILTNQFDGRVTSLEAVLALVTGVASNIYDPGTRVVTIALAAPVSATIQALLTNVDLLPRPGGTAYVLLFPLAAVPITVSGTATTATAAGDTSISKPTGAAGWDSGGYDVTTYNTIAFGWRIPNAADVVACGFATNPAASPSYTNLAFGIQGNAGTIEIYEAGTLVGSYGAYAAGDRFLTYFDGREVVYLHNGAIIRTVAYSGGSLAAQVCLYDVGAVVDEISLAVS